MKLLKKWGQTWWVDKCSCVVTEGAQAVVGDHIGLLGL